MKERGRFRDRDKETEMEEARRIERVGNTYEERSKERHRE